MQKMITILAAGLLLNSLLHAQENTGRIVYEKKTNVHRTLKDERLKNYVPEFKTSKFELKFQDNKWVYKKYVELDNPDNVPTEMEGRTVIVSTAGASESEEYFFDYATQKSVRVIEIGSNTYNLKDSLKQYQWTITTDTATIAGYLCTKATTTYRVKRSQTTSRTISSNGSNSTSSPTQTDNTEKEIAIEAWFTAKLANYAGPENFHGLPGTILYLNMNHGEQVFTPISIDTKTVIKNIKEPTKGKRITKDELAKIQMKMFENLQQRSSSGGSVSSFSIGN